MGSTPMFPLGSVLVPGMPLPLHVFEDRYRALAMHCLEHEAPFGVALIERGQEVGGGDTRFGIGCLARIVDAHRFEDGRFALVAVGTERIKITEWLDDDPYPLAVTEAWPDEPGEPDADDVEAVRNTLRRSLALAAEIGLAAAPATSDLSDDPEVLGWQVTSGSPLPSIDRLRLLAAPSLGDRFRLGRRYLAEAIEGLELQLAAGRGDDDEWSLPE
ncbi:MAG: LON peptidase substrate-binding domain-containing protein [Actinomycetota bacterium]